MVAGGGDAGPAPMGLEGKALLIAQSVSFFGFAALNVGLNFYNSWLLKKRFITSNSTNATHHGSPADTELFISTQHLNYHVSDAEGISPEAPVDGNPNFNFPVFYTMWHMLASVLGATVIMTFVAKPKLGFPCWSQFWVYKWGLILISTCTALNIGMNNISLTLISLFLNQVIKATGP